MTQCSTNEIRDAPMYNSCSLPIQVMTTGPMPVLSKCKSGLPRITGTCPGWWKQSFRLRLWCSTMWVGCQSRQFNCLFWRETRQRILGHEISPYPEVVRGGEWELTTRPKREELRVAAGDHGRQLVVGQEQRQLAWIHGGAVNTRHRAERRGDKIGSSEEESQDVWFQ